MTSKKTHASPSAIRRYTLLGFCATLFASCASKPISSSPPKPEILNASITPSEHPVGSEWRAAQAWAYPGDFYQGAYDLWQNGIQICMKSKGLNYTPAKYVDDKATDTLINPLNEAVTVRYGYHEPPVLPPNPTDGASGAFAAALQGNGTKGSGCAQIAFSFAYQSPKVSGYQDGLAALLAEVETGVMTFESSQENASLTSSWKACMKASGYNFGAPLDANTKFSEAASVTAEELRVRAADLTCDRTVGLTKGRSEYERRKLDGVLPSVATKITELEGLRRLAFNEVLSRSRKLSETGASALGTDG